MLIFANIAGWAIAHWKWLLYAAAGIVLFIVIVIAFKSCGSKPKLNEKEIQRAEQAVKERNDKVLKEILAESDTRVDAIDSNIKQVEQNTRDAVKSYEGYTVDELAAEIERRK